MHDRGAKLRARAGRIAGFFCASAAQPDRLARLDAAQHLRAGHQDFGAYPLGKVDLGVIKEKV